MNLLLFNFVSIFCIHNGIRLYKHKSICLNGPAWAGKQKNRNWLPRRDILSNPRLQLHLQLQISRLQSLNRYHNIPYLYPKPQSLLLLRSLTTSLLCLEPLVQIIHTCSRIWEESWPWLCLHFVLKLCYGISWVEAKEKISASKGVIFKWITKDIVLRIGWRWKLPTGKWLLGKMVAELMSGSVPSAEQPWQEY